MLIDAFYSSENFHYFFLFKKNKYFFSSEEFLVKAINDSKSAKIIAKNAAPNTIKRSDMKYSLSPKGDTYPKEFPVMTSTAHYI